MLCLVGLGNPGPEYAETRHNVGFHVLERLAQRHDVRISRNRFRSLYGSGRIAGQSCILVKPLTYMNDSGEAVGRLTYFYQIPPEQVVLIYDDLALDLGVLRLRRGGSAAGHNGVKSVIAHLRTDAFPRLRLGIGPLPEKKPSRDFVLSPFLSAQRETAEEMIQRGGEALELMIREGLEAAMNRYNA
jgi:peptidyl-tRNA hydrolase, PTH1 family